MDKVCYDAKENIKKGLERLNRESVNNENAELYDSLTEALYHLELIEAMKKNDNGYSGVSYDGTVHMSREGSIDRDHDGYYNESGRMVPRWYYSGHTGKDHMMEDLKKMMADADSEKERRRIKDLMEDLEEMRG